MINRTILIKSPFHKQNTNTFTGTAEVNEMQSGVDSSYPEGTEAAKIAMETMIEGIGVAGEALVFYDKLVENIIPWTDLNNTLQQLDRFQEDYSTGSALLISEIKTLMMNGIDAYFSASQDVYELAGTIATHLELYIKLFNGHDARQAEAQKNLLIKIFDSGLKKLKSAQEQLGESSASFNAVFGQLSTLRKRFEDEFDAQSEFFQTKMKVIDKGSRLLGLSIFGLSGFFLGAEFGYQKYVRELQQELERIKRFYYFLQVKIAQASNNIDDTKKVLRTEIQHISDLKVQILQTQTFVDLDYVPDLRDKAINTAQNLIAKCMGYRKRHIEKNELN